jgi:hypothetical protein
MALGITGWRPLVRAATYPSSRPRVQFDHVLAHALDGARIGPASVVRLPVSDHCALTVDLHVRPRVTEPERLPAAAPAPAGEDNPLVPAGASVTVPEAAR